MAKKKRTVSKNSRTERKTESKDHVKVISFNKKGGNYRYSEKVIHKDTLDNYLENIKSE